MMDRHQAAAQKRAFLSSLPSDAESVLTSLAAIDDAWWVAAAAIAAVRSGVQWLAVDAERVLNYATERTASFDQEVQGIAIEAKRRRSATVSTADLILEWLDADPHRLPRVILRRKLWHMRWLLSIPQSRSKSAHVESDLAALADIPFLEHAQNLCLAGNERGLRALIGTHATVARSLYPHRFGLLHMLLTAGGVSPERLLQLRLLPGTRLPVEDRESGAWIDALAAPTPTSLATAALWVEHPAVITALSLRGAAIHPVAPSAPPDALSDWYMGVVRELEGRLGLVDAALDLAKAGERLGLVPLRTAAEELSFLHMLVYDLHAGDAHSITTLHRARASELVSLVTSQPLPPDLVIRHLHDSVLPFLQRGTYADAHALPAFTPSEWGVYMMLVALDTQPHARVLTFIEAMMARPHPWLSDADRARLVLAVVGTSEAVDATSLSMYSKLVHALEDGHASPLHGDEVEAAGLGDARPDKPPSSLYLVLARTLDANPYALSQRLTVVSPSLLAEGLRDFRVLVDMTVALSRAGAHSHAPRFFWADDVQAHRAHEVTSELVQHALAQRGNERHAIERVLCALAPWIGVHRPRLPVTCVRTFFRQLLLAREPVVFNEVVQALPVICPSLACHMTATQAEDLVLETARAWMDQTPTCDPLHGLLQRAREALEAMPHTTRIRNELAFLNLLARLHEYAWPSSAEPLTPRRVRAVPQKLELFARVLAYNRDAYQTRQIRSLGEACSEGSGSTDNAVRISAMLVDAAAANGDLVAACRECERLVTLVQAIDRATNVEAYDAAWRTCFQLAKNPLWTDEQTRAQVLAHALTLAPPDHMPSILAAMADLPAHAGVPSVTRRENRAGSAWARLLTRPTHDVSSRTSTTAQLLDSVTSQHAPQAARMARSFLDNLSARWLVE